MNINFIGTGSNATSVPGPPNLSRSNSLPGSKVNTVQIDTTNSNNKTSPSKTVKTANNAGTLLNVFECFPFIIYII